MKFNIHAGHNPDGKVACGAVGLIKESTEARKVKTKVIKLLKEQGHTVYDCTVSNGTSQSDVLQKIVKKCNAHKVDLDVSIHFNAGGGNGTEAYVYSKKSKAYDEATKIVKAISAIGFKNRGVKVNDELYVLKHTDAPAILLEVAFTDSKTDCELYKKNIDKIAQAIVNGLVGTYTSFLSFKVKVTADALNVRAGAGTDYKVNTIIKRGEVYTIVDVVNGWGKLKSGSGYINLKYTDRL